MRERQPKARAEVKAIVVGTQAVHGHAVPTVVERRTKWTILDYLSDAPSGPGWRARAPRSGHEPADLVGSIRLTRSMSADPMRQSAQRCLLHAVRSLPRADLEILASLQRMELFNPALKVASRCSTQFPNWNRRAAPERGINLRAHAVFAPSGCSNSPTTCSRYLERRWRRPRNCWPGCPHLNRDASGCSCALLLDGTVGMRSLRRQPPGWPVQ